MEKVKIEYVNVTDVTPYANNPRKNEKAVAAVAKSIKEFGILQPLVIDSDGTLVAGHTRLLACLELGVERVPCVRAHDKRFYVKHDLRLAAPSVVLREEETIADNFVVTAKREQA